MAELIITPELQNLSWSADTYSQTVTYPNGAIVEPPQIIGETEWAKIDLVSNTGNAYDYEITLQQNEGLARTLVFRYSCEMPNGEYVSELMSIVQIGYGGTEPTITSNIKYIKFYADGTPVINSQVKFNIANIDNIDIRYGVSDADMWCDIVNAEFTKVSDTIQSLTLTLTIAFNSGAYRQGEVFCAADVFGTVSVAVMQAANNGEVEPEPSPSDGGYCGPIWKDVVYNFGNVQMADYSIWTNNEMVFKGRAWMEPRAKGQNTIIVNKICENYLNNPSILANGENVSTAGYREFELRGDNDELLRVYRFFNNWTYDKDYEYDGLLTSPIIDNTKVAKSQFLPFGVLSKEAEQTVSYGIRYNGGWTDIWGQAITDYTNNAVVKRGLNNIQFPSKDKAPEDKVVSAHIGEKEYQYVENCQCPYVIYYLNPMGGWDWFPIYANKGRVVESDAVTSYEYSKNYLNTELEFGNNRYLCEITRKWDIYTQRLTDDQSRKMWWLLESNAVYIHNTIKDVIYPVVIKNSGDIRFITRKDGYVQYQFTLQSSHTQERR